MKFFILDYLLVLVILRVITSGSNTYPSSLFKLSLYFSVISVVIPFLWVIITESISQLFSFPWHILISSWYIGNDFWICEIFIFLIFLLFFRGREIYASSLYPRLRMSVSPGFTETDGIRQYTRPACISFVFSRYLPYPVNKLNFIGVVPRNPFLISVFGKRTTRSESIIFSCVRYPA